MSNFERPSMDGHDDFQNLIVLFIWIIPLSTWTCSYILSKIAFFFHSFKDAICGLKDKIQKIKV